MRKIDFIIYLLSILLMVILILTRFVPIPFGLFTAASGSMEPSIRPLDLAIVFGKDYKVGDVVVWCSSTFYCVLHRIVYISENYIITKGDANPVSDPPISKDLIRGRVVLVIPREIWTLLTSFFIGILIFYYRRRVYETVIVSVASVAPIIIYSLIVGVMIALFTQQYSIQIVHPEIHLSRYDIYDVNGSCVVNISYYEVGIKILSVRKIYIFNRSINSFNYTNNSISFILPKDLALYHASTGSRVNVYVEADLSRKGFLKGFYQIPISLRKPLIKIINESLYIENPNCYPLEFNITWMFSVAGEPWRFESSTYVLEKGSLMLNPPQAKFVYVEVRYRWLGAEFYERLYVRG